MSDRWFPCALALCLAGCFADPPGSGSGSGSGADASSGEPAGTSSSTSGDATTSDDSTTSTSSGVLDGSSGSSGFECELVSADPPRVPADIAVLIDNEVPASTVAAALDALSAPEANNLAIIVPEGVAASVDVQVECLEGCGVNECPSNPRRIIVPYDSAQSPFDTLATFGRFDCVFRDPMPQTSGPVSNLWYITHRPDFMPPKGLGALVLDGELSLRVHVSCPECDENLFNANALLAQVVDESGGTVSDYETLAQMVMQVNRLGEERYSCTWATDADPVLLEFDTPAGTVLAERIDGPSGCEVDGGEISYAAFFSTAFGVALCPEACQALQAVPADSVSVSECI
ncbi:MAG: hypothetical protein ACE37F_20850 [Nannocystaceae bacterium]|nr:hypothetical protein [bacterium]